MNISTLSDYQAHTYLINAGITIDKQSLDMKSYRKWDDLPESVRICINYLQVEWEYGDFIYVGD